MSAAPRTLFFELETEWLQEYASTYFPSDAPFRYAPQDLRDANASVVDVRHLFRSGKVVWRDKLDDPGALWVVEGGDCNGRFLRVEVVVVTEEFSVTLMSVGR